jgi:two-component system, OmpR family, response regulator VicR
MKALIIEDDKSIIDIVNLAFEFRWPGVSVLSATSGQEGLDLVKHESPDIVILDINLPDINGFSVLKEIRTFSSVPVIILTVRSDDEDVFRGLETGADDYITKPFNYMTLLARVKAVIRRSEKASIVDTHVTSFGPHLKIDFVDQKVWVDDKPVKLPPVEYRLLVLLVKNKDNIVSYQEIMKEVWDKTSFDNIKNIWICTRRLRRNLRDNPPKMILNKHGTGYLFKTQ